MALNVVLAEFPTWELLQCTSIFHLSASRTHAHVHGDEADQSTAFAIRLRRLAKFCEVDAAQFEEQFEYLLPLAQWHRDNQPKIANVECWRLAKAEVDAARKRKAAFRDSRPIGELGLGLAAYAAWQGCVTSGTESCFSKGRRNLSGRELLAS